MLCARPKNVMNFVFKPGYESAKISENLEISSANHVNYRNFSTAEGVPMHICILLASEAF